MSAEGFYVHDRATLPGLHISRAVARPGRVGPKRRFGADSGNLQYTRRRGAGKSGGAGWLSTAPDYARFMQMLLQADEMDGTRYIQDRERVALMA